MCLGGNDNDFRIDLGALGQYLSFKAEIISGIDTFARISTLKSKFCVKYFPSGLFSGGHLDSFCGQKTSFLEILKHISEMFSSCLGFIFDHLSSTSNGILSSIG